LKTLKSIKNISEIRRFIKNHQRLVHTGNLAEFWCEKLCGIKLASKTNEKGYDGITKKGEKVEIKHRKIKGNIPLGMKIDTKNISYIYYVIMDDELLPINIYRYNVKYIKPRENGRVSFKEAHDKGNFEIIYAASKKASY
jgi:hypothetical protein